MLVTCIIWVSQTVSSAVALASLVGGLGGSITAILVVKRLPPLFIIVVAAIGGAATHVRGYPTSLTRLHSRSSCWVFTPLLEPHCIPFKWALFSWADTSGRLAMLAWFVQLIACAIGPAVGGFVLHVSSYSVLALVCALGYLLFVCAALVLVPVREAKCECRDGWPDVRS